MNALKFFNRLYTNVVINEEWLSFAICNDPNLGLLSIVTHLVNKMIAWNVNQANQMFLQQIVILVLHPQIVLIPWM